MKANIFFFYQSGNVYLVEEVQNYTYNIWDCYFWELLNNEVRHPDGKNPVSVFEIY